MSCVNTSSREFKSLLSKVNVSSGTLELLIHKLQNDNENAPYPTPSEVIAKLSPKAFTSNADTIHAWVNNYSEPRYFRTKDEAEFFFMEDAIRIFGKDSVSLTQVKNGGYIVEVGRPDILPFNLNGGIWSELKNTIKEGPKDALLKSFIEVFEVNGKLPIVDISYLPNVEYIDANGIKTNGVPLAMGGRDSIVFDTNTLLSLMQETSPNMREKVFKQYFLHELTHSVTLAAINKAEAGKGTKEEKDFYNEINRIYNIAKEAMGKEAGSYYGMDNIKEFLAEITSNLSFQKRLASIKDTKKKNLWNAIVNAFASFFNKYFNMAIKDSVLESGLKSLSEYIQYAKNNSASIEATPTELARKVNSVTPETFLTFNSLSDLQRFLQNEGFTVGVGNSNKTEAEAHIIGKHKYNGAYWLKQWTDKSLTNNTNVAKNLLNEVLSNLGIADKGVVTIKDTSKGTIVEFNKEAFDKAKEDILENVQDRDYYENSLLSESEQYDLEILDSVDSELSSLVKEGKLSIYEAKDLFEQKNGISIYYQSNPDMAFSQAPSDTLNFYEGNIEPSDDTIFVFGSNPEGRHGAGAAKIAREQFGAVYGQGEGLQGNAYALPTKDLRVKKNNSLRSISPEQIIKSIKKLYETAKQNPDKQFKVAYRNTDRASLNGYTGLEMIDMFTKAGPIPSNIVFSKEWIDTGKFNQQISDNTQNSKSLFNSLGELKGDTDISEIINNDGTINFNKLEEITDKYFKNADSSLFKKGRKTLRERQEKHFDVNGNPIEANTLEHLINVTKSASEINIKEELKPTLVLAAALHDIAKPFHGGQRHGFQSVDVINSVFKGNISPLVKFAVRHHMLTLEESKEFTIDDAKRIIQDAIDNNLNIQDTIDVLLALNTADIMMGQKPSDIDRYSGKTKKETIEEEIPVKRKLLELAAKELSNNESQNNINNQNNLALNFKPEEAEFYSGAATGSDKAWEEAATKAGIKVKNYTVTNWDKLSNEERERLDKEYQEVVNTLGRKVLDINSYSGKLVRRDMLQADKADAIFAVGKVASNGYVDGGTGYATTRGIIRGIPVYLFDQSDSTWKVWDKEQSKFVPTIQPSLTKNAAVVGTRNLQNNGREAINNIFTINPQQSFQATNQQTTSQSLQSSNTDITDYVNTEGKDRGFLTKKGEELLGTTFDKSKFNKGTFSVALYPGPSGTTLMIGFISPKGNKFYANYNSSPTRKTWDLLNSEQQSVTDVNSEKYWNIINTIVPKSLRDLVDSGKYYKMDTTDMEKGGEASLIKRSELEDYFEKEYNVFMQGRSLDYNTKQINKALSSIQKNSIPSINVQQETNKGETKTPTSVSSYTGSITSDANTIENNKQDLYTTKQQEKMQQIDNLLGGNLLSATEVRHIAEQAVYWISDHITELQENPELAKTIYGDRFKNEDGTDKDFASMTRADVVRTIGVDNIVEMCKQKFSPEHNDFDNDDTLDKAFAITDNWQAIMLLAQDSFLNLEDFSIVSTPDGKANEVNENLVGDADNFNESNDQSDVEEVEGSLQEHWQIESRCQDVLGTMSQMVRRALLKCYILDKDGNNVQSEFGINERINVREATNSILRWTQGSLSLADMVTKLQEKQEDNPWVKQLINRLSDTSGKETDFQGQFYGTFSKHFQPYSVVIEEDGKYKSIQVNENPALSEAMTQVTTQYKIGEHPLFTTDGINKKSFEELRAAYDSLEKFKHMGYDLSKEVNKDEAANTLGYISNLFGYYVTPDMVKNNLTNENYKKMYSALGYIIKSFENNLDNASYEPFKFKAKDSINGNMREFLKPITEQLEDIAVSAFYDSGKMYQSYVTPSYMSKLMQKFSQKGEAFDKFLTEEFGNQPWFHEGTDIERGWRNSWLRALATDSKTREIFKHKVQLNFNKHNYMRNMSDMEYTLSLFTEYFSEGVNDKQSRVPAWFRVPMLSNKPSSEFIRFYSERGTNYKETITDGMMDIFNQELSRIQTVLMRNLDSKDPRFIKNFDKNGKKFCFLDFMNDYLTGDKKNSELGKLINDKVNGKEVDEAKLYELANKAIFDTMDARAKSIVEKWIDAGLIEGAKKITGIGVTEEEIKSNLENFVWNDTFAAMNIMELTVTDIAYYKNAEDLQKRLAQIHAPGIRGNVEATDYEGRKVSDGKERTFYLTDWDNFISNIIDNVSIVFDRKIAEAPEAEKAGYKALKESLVGENGAFRNINVADAQGYSSPTSYRKKAFIFGKWSKKAEDIYQKLRKGDYNYNDLSVAFQPLKPFVYSQIEKSSGVAKAPLDKFKVPVQNKNSEYLLIMADAILQNENTGRPNLLRAIYEVMEESHYDEDGNYKTDGIDTVQFESTVKSGLMGRINLNKYVNDANGEAKAKAVMEACLYETTPKTVQEVNPETGELEDVTINTKTGKYSQTYVHELPLEDYCLQQEVPEHFKNHEQVHGSQLRYIVVSELATKDSFGNDATYEVEGRKVSADEFKAEYEQTVADNIEDSISELESTLGLNSTSTKDRNIALSKILQREILSSPRYGVDLLQACSVDENGRFRIPLGDPIQSKRVEQLINSIIKNRVNKQEIAGGPVVQVTNFGTSRELNIRFKDKNGGLLKTRAEYEKSPIKKELSQTDKFNAKYKGLKTSERTMPYKDYIKENQGGIAYFEVFAPIYANNLFNQFADKNGNISIEALEALDPDLLKMIGYRIPTEAKYSMAPLKIVGFLPREAGDGIMLPNDITLLTGSDFDVDKEYLMRKDYGISRNKITKSALHKILYDSLIESQSGELSYGAKSKLNSLVRQFLEDPFDRASLVNQKTADGFMSIPSSSYSKLLKLYLQNAFTVEKPTEGRIYRNNKIVDMTYEVLTHETSCAEMLNPGGFDPQKRMGYLVTALRTTDKSYEKLSKMSIDELKDLSDKDKNLMFIDTHVQFYKQNSAAGSLIGIFAVNRTAHAVIENEGYMVNVDNACRLTRPFTVADMTFGGNMPIDVRFDNNGQSVGKVLGSLVASAADAVKDPVLNLMNINSNTANILNTLVRLGMPFDDAALFLSQRAISSALNQFSSENITGFTSLSKVVDDRIKRIEKDLNIDENSSLNEEELTREQLIEGIKSSDPRIEYKVLKSFRNFQRLADAMRMPTFATRFNSVNSAVGPLIIDNLITEHKMEKLSSESNILGSDGEEISINDIFLAHPILNQFRRALGIAQSLFGNMPANSTGFRNILTYASENPIGNAILSDRKVLSSLSDFYQSYLVVAGNVVNSSDLSKVISEFPKEFMEKNYKKQYDNNLLIQSIKYGTDKGGRATLQIDITGLDTQQKERLSSAWIDLHRVNPELSEQLFKYCFFRAGIGFSPKTFMSLVPVYVKERLNSYVNTFRVLPSSTPEIVLDQFIRNNWDNNRLVPRKKNLVMRHLENSNFEVYKESDVKELQKTQYFKMKVDNVDKLYQQVLLKDDSIEYKEVNPLGSNKDYLEVSVDGIDKPIEIPSASLEDNEKSEISPSTDGEAKSDESTPSKQEQIDLLHQIYMTKGKTFADAEKTIQSYKAMDNEFKKAVESQVKKFMKSRLETLGIKFDERTIEEEYKKLC